MQRGEPYQLEYSTPKKSPQESTLGSSGPWISYWFGLIIGSLGMPLIVLWRFVPGVIVYALISLVAGLLFSVPAVVIFILRSYRSYGPFRRSANRWFFPLVTFLFYPSAHLLMCKWLAVITKNDRYPITVSPLRYFSPWIACGAAATALTWNRAPIGERKLTWILAGIAWPAAAYSIAEGLLYLRYSWSGSYVVSGGWYDFMFAALSYPILVGFVFVDVSSEPSAAPLTGR